MPRTRAPRKENQKDEFTILLTKWSDAKLAEINKSRQILFERLDAHNKEARLAIPLEIVMKTATEMEVHSEASSLASFASNLSKVAMKVNSNISKQNSKKQLMKRSSSLVDEGYLTAESSNSATTGGRKSRARERQRKTPRVSRSLTQGQRSKKDTLTANSFKTPHNRAPPATYATVTPKVAPNTPQVVLRRPNMGEMVLSLQGSPIFTGNVNSENAANINVPLEGGKLLSIQPQRGLRLSQIPDLNPEIKRQLEVLRDNLNKFCAKR